MLTNDQQVDPDCGGAKTVGALAPVDARVLGLDSADLQSLLARLEPGPRVVDDPSLSVFGPVDHGVGVSRHGARQAGI